MNDKTLIVRQPTDRFVTDEEMQAVRDAIIAVQNAPPPTALVLPLGWTYELIEPDTPIIVEKQ